MAKYYKPFFLLYGGMHFFAGLAFWIVPSLTQLFLYTPLSPDAAALMGFASALAGLGFIGAAFVTDATNQRLVLILSIIGNLLNVGVHGQNVARGYSPPVLIGAAVVSIGIMITILFLIRQDISG